MNKVSAVYQIKNMITGDFYIGSSKDVKRRWKEHKCPSVWKHRYNSKLYQDMQKYGLENFKFMIIAPAYPGHLRRMEQEFIEILKPTYNNIYAKGWNKERYKKAISKANKKYRQKSDKYRKYMNEYDRQMCIYNGKELTLSALRKRFRKAGIPHPTIEARKYIIGE